MTAKQFLTISAIALGLSVLIEAVFVHHHAVYWWQGLIGFDIAYGFLGCVGLIIAAKFVLKAIVSKDEDYYEGGGKHHD
jgi:hypothetical protein